MGYTVRPSSPVIRPETPVIRPASPVIRPSAPVVHPGAGAAVPTIPVTSGLILELYYDVGVSVDGGDRLTAWLDQSGAGNHADIFSATAPILTAGGVHCDAAGRYVGRSNNVGGPVTAAATVFLVSTVTDISGVEIMCQTTDNAKGIRVTSGLWQANDSANLAGSAADTSEHRHGARFGSGATDDALFVDAVNVTGNGTAGNDLSSVGWLVSRTDGFGAVQIVKSHIRFDRRLDDTEMGDMATFLAARFA